MGGALSLALAAARLQGDDELAQLLEFAKITDNNGELSLDLALPEDYLKKHLDKACSEILNPPEPQYLEIDEAEEYDDDSPPLEDEVYEEEADEDYEAEEVELLQE